MAVKSASAASQTLAAGSASLCLERKFKVQGLKPNDE
jgi:hypothetical protein